MEHGGLTENAAHNGPPLQSQRKVYAIRLLGFVVMWLVVAFPTAMIHLGATGLQDTPGSAPMTTGQAWAAAAANPMGPWAGHAVRLVRFPNAGLRNFDLRIALGLSALFVILVGIGTAAKKRVVRWTVRVLFAVLLPVWYGYGLFLIADGML